MNKTKISARKFANLLARNNNYEAAFYYMTQSGTQINESILSDDLIVTLTQKAKDKTYYDFEVCPANQDSSSDEMNEKLRHPHPFDVFDSGVVVSFWDCTNSAQTYIKILLYNK